MFKEMGNERVLEYKLEESMKTENYQVEMFSRNAIQGCINFIKVSKDGADTFYYPLKNMISLPEYLGKKENRVSELYELVRRISEVSKNIENFYLDADNFLLHKDYIFFNRVDKSVWFIYLPVSREVSFKSQFNELVQDLLYDVMRFHIEDQGTINGLVEYIKDKEVTLDEFKQVFEETLDDDSGKKVITDHSGYGIPEVLNEIITADTKMKEEPIEKPKRVKKDKPEKEEKKGLFGLFGSKPKKEKKEKVKKEKVKKSAEPKKRKAPIAASEVEKKVEYVIEPEKEDHVTSFIEDEKELVYAIEEPNEEKVEEPVEVAAEPVAAVEEVEQLDEEVTVLLADFEDQTVLLEELDPPLVLTITSKDKDIEVSTAKFPFIIGRNPITCDYVMESKVISKRHVEIIKKDKQLLVMDLCSSNGSYINKKKLVEREYKEIKSGDTLKLANIELDVTYA